VSGPETNQSALRQGIVDNDVGSDREALPDHPAELVDEVATMR
jgi:hypothetical protein